MKKKLNLLINTAVLLLAVFIAYKTFLPGKEPINKVIIDNFFANSDTSKLFKIKDSNEKQYLFLKDKNTIIFLELDENLNKIKQESNISFEEYWFTEKNRGFDTYLVLFVNKKKKEYKLYDNDIRPVSKLLTP